MKNEEIRSKVAKGKWSLIWKKPLFFVLLKLIGIIYVQRLNVDPREENRQFLTFVIPHDKEPLLTVTFCFNYILKKKAHLILELARSIGFYNRNSSRSFKTERESLGSRTYNSVLQRSKRSSWISQSKLSLKVPLPKEAWWSWTYLLELHFRSGASLLSSSYIATAYLLVSLHLLRTCNFLKSILLHQNCVNSLSWCVQNLTICPFSPSQKKLVRYPLYFFLAYKVS